MKNDKHAAEQADLPPRVKKVEHEALGLSFELPNWGLVQRDVESFYAALQEQGVRGALAPIRNGAIVRAAINCGWLEGQLAIDEVEGMHPAGITWLAAEIDQIVAEAYVIPGE